MMQTHDKWCACRDCDDTNPYDVSYEYLISRGQTILAIF